MLVDGCDVVVLLVDIVANALGRLGQGVFIYSLQALMFVVGLLVGGDAVVRCI